MDSVEGLPMMTVCHQFTPKWVPRSPSVKGTRPILDTLCMKSYKDYYKVVTNSVTIVAKDFPFGNYFYRLFYKKNDFF